MMYADSREARSMSLELSPHNPEVACGGRNDCLRQRKKGLSCSDSSSDDDGGGGGGRGRGKDRLKSEYETVSE